MKRDDLTRTKTSKKKEYRVSSLQFTVFVAEGEAWGTYGHLVRQTKRVILYMRYINFTRTNILILMIKHKSLCVVSTSPLPPSTTRMHLTVVRAQRVRN